MPDLVLENSPHPEINEMIHTQNVINILGVMLYPESEDYRKIFDATRYQELSKPFCGQNISPSIPLEDLNNIARKAELPEPNKRRLMGLNVGYILNIVLRCKQHHPGWATLASAYRIVEYELNKNKREHKIKQSKGRDTLENQWKLMCSVAHLWTAQHDFTDNQWMLPNYFSLFLAFAESIRELGETHFAPLGRLTANSAIKSKSKKPLLNPESTWKVPDGFHLPKMSAPNLPRLPDEALSLLAEEKKLPEI